MQDVYAIEQAPLSEASGAWTDAVARILYEMQLEFQEAEAFSGYAVCRNFGSLRFSRFKSKAVKYRRLRRHCEDTEPQILVSVPLTGSIEFEQLGRHVRCEPGQFLLQSSSEPYEFSYSEPSDMWVLKIPEFMLQCRITSVRRFCAMQFDASVDVGNLFRDYVALIARHCAISGPKFQSLIGVQLIDLLGAVLEADPRVTQSAGSAVKAAHIARIEQYVRHNLTDVQLTPDKVAGACNISVRYLHLLFKESGRTLSRWIRDLRLQAAYEVLQHGASGTSVAQTAYHFGFSDHAQFANAFRRQFGRTPSDLLRSARAIGSKD